MNLTVNTAAKRQNPNFGMKRVDGFNIKAAIEAGILPDAFIKQLDELGERIEKRPPFDREIVFDFEKSCETVVFKKVMDAYYQYLIKPFDIDPQTGHYTDKHTHYITGHTFKNDEEFFNTPLTGAEKSYLVEQAEWIGMMHEEGQIVLNLAKK